MAATAPSTAHFVAGDELEPHLSCAGTSVVFDCIRCGATLPYRPQSACHRP
jgi:hypothetical protein